MNTPIPPRDLEDLSAYLDNQLGTGERARLEARLQLEPGLRQTLNDLGRTQQALRAQPRRRAPRNFTLTPEMAGLRRGPSASARRSMPAAYPILRLSSALATFFLVLFLAGDFFLRWTAPGPAWVALGPAPEEAQSAPMLGMGGGGGGGGMAEPAMAPAPMDAPAAEMAKVAEPVTGTENAMVVTPLGPMGLETATAPGILESAAAAAPEPAPMEAESLPVQAAQPPTGPGVSGWSLLRFIQLALLILAAVTGVAAWLMYRKART